MPWQIAMLLFYTFAVAGTLWQRYYARRSHLPIAVLSALAYIFGVMPVATVLWLLSGAEPVRWTHEALVLLIAEGVTIGVSYWLGFAALKYLYVSQYQTISQLSVLVSLVIAWLVLQERLSSWQLVGVALITGAVLLAANVSRLHHRKFRGIFSKGALLALGAALTLGAGVVAERALLNHMSLANYHLYGFGVQALALLVVAVLSLRRHHMPHFTHFELGASMLSGLFLVGGGIFYLAALADLGSVSATSVIASLSLPLSVLAGFFVLHERDDRLKLFAASCIALVGLVLMGLAI